MTTVRHSRHVDRISCSTKWWCWDMTHLHTVTWYSCKQSCPDHHVALLKYGRHVNRQASGIK